VAYKTFEIIKNHLFFSLTLKLSSKICIFGPKGAIQIRQELESGDVTPPLSILARWRLRLDARTVGIATE